MQSGGLELGRGTWSKITNFRLCFPKVRTETAWKVGLGSMEEEERMVPFLRGILTLSKKVPL